MRRQAKADSVPTVAYSDSLGEGGGGGTVPYYLASAFDQIYVHETGLVSFTGAPCTCRMHPLPVWLSLWTTADPKLVGWLDI